MTFLERLKKEGLTFQELGILFAIGTIANIYFLSSFSFSIDDELAATRKDPLIWVAQGRWATYVLEKLIFPQPSVPFAPFLVLIACMRFVNRSILAGAHAFGRSHTSFRKRD